ncbi:hypothetical protein L1887_51896 [Cichorium endivia]|nr:hypothetical protein L1887_51896 [Cichorium endivia]
MTNNLSVPWRSDAGVMQSLKRVLCLLCVENCDPHIPHFDVPHLWPAPVSEGYSWDRCSVPFLRSSHSTLESRSKQATFQYGGLDELVPRRRVGGIRYRGPRESCLFLGPFLGRRATDGHLSHCASLARG